LLFLPEADALEQAALLQALFDQRGAPTNLPVRVGKADIDGPPGPEWGDG